MFIALSACKCLKHYRDCYFSFCCRFEIASGWNVSREELNSLITGAVEAFYYISRGFGSAVLQDASCGRSNLIVHPATEKAYTVNHRGASEDWKASPTAEAYPFPCCTPIHSVCSHYSVIGSGYFPSESLTACESCENEFWIMHRMFRIDTGSS